MFTSKLFKKVKISILIQKLSLQINCSWTWIILLIGGIPDGECLFVTIAKCAKFHKRCLYLCLLIFHWSICTTWLWSKSTWFWKEIWAGRRKGIVWLGVEAKWHNIIWLKHMDESPVYFILYIISVSISL